MKKQLIIVILFVLFLVGCTIGNGSNEQMSPPEENQQEQQISKDSADVGDNKKNVSDSAQKKIDFSNFDNTYKFSAEIPENFEIEYVESISSINIFNPLDSASSTREKSQIFIRKFTSSRFETLSTVDILSKTETRVKNRPAVAYEIEKKSSAALLSEQPSWRNGKHNVIDIRSSAANPSVFYVISYNPSLSQEIFDAFIDSLVFEESYTGFSDPLKNMSQREIIKPYGIEITPGNSPVSPERFSGFHNALDLEVLENEDVKNVEFFAVCTGELIRKTTASGYGGYIVQECSVHNTRYSILYGHVDIDSISFSVGDTIEQSQKIGVLGEEYSPETDGERGHLHIAIQPGSQIDIRGYVQSKNELSQWVDPQPLFPFTR